MEHPVILDNDLGQNFLITSLYLFSNNSDDGGEIYTSTTITKSLSLLLNSERCVN